MFEASEPFCISGDCLSGQKIIRLTGTSRNSKSPIMLLDVLFSRYRQNVRSRSLLV